MGSSAGFGVRNMVDSLGLRDTAERLLEALPDRMQTRLRELRADAYVSAHRQGVRELQILPIEPLKALQRNALRYLVSRHGANSVGDYLEFGVFAGTSLGCMAEVLKELRLEKVRLFGYDSFEGMPASAETEDEGTWQPGQFKFDIEVTKAILRSRGADMSRIKLTKGWFDRTLTPGLRKQYGLRKASVIMVDCDLYSSTVEVLRFVEPLILDEAILIFDDWNANDLASKDMGEKRAFAEFLHAHPELSARPLPFDSYASHAYSFLVTRAPSA
ncbi:MAG TPA: TylF/MycF/NovP-related O-methyltransferase [Polyangiales bacterium]|nr:TylF/MycF/NovP-related O-methyltransferase [Polyangiales bacterium]